MRRRAATRRHGVLAYDRTVFTAVMAIEADRDAVSDEERAHRLLLVFRLAQMTAERAGALYPVLAPCAEGQVATVVEREANHDSLHRRTWRRRCLADHP